MAPVFPFLRKSREISPLFSNAALPKARCTIRGLILEFPKHPQGGEYIGPKFYRDRSRK
jgi:hypothetical protein